MAVIGLLGIVFSCSSIYFLLLRKIRLSSCQNCLIMNVAISDVLVSIAGLFRGLGIIDGKFVGAWNNSTTPYCAAYTLFLNSAFSGMLALVPLTIDRAVAVLMPLRHSVLITKRTCAFMFAATWVPIFGLLFYQVGAYIGGTITVTYNARYHRCVIPEKELGLRLYHKFVFHVIPFCTILFVYAMMFFIVIRRSNRLGRFLVTASGIIMTSLLAYSPSLIADTWSIPLNYQVAQILTVTLAYTNGIVNPIIYLATHPATWKYAKSLGRRTRASFMRSSVNRSVIEPRNSSGKPEGAFNSLSTGTEIVCVPNLAINYSYC